jgi:hypothetical protein
MTMLETLLIATAKVHPLAVVFLFPGIVLVAGVITLAVLSAVMLPDRDDSVTLTRD